MRSRIALVAAGLALAAATFLPVTPAAAQDCATGASLRILNLSPDAGAVDVLINGTRVLTNVAGATSSTFVPVAAGTLELQINQTGTETVVVAPVAVTTTAGSRITVATLTTTPAGGGQQPSKAVVTTTVFQDDLTPPAAGQAKIRVIHGSADAGAVDVLAGDQVLVSNLAYPNASPFIEVPAGSYALRVNAAGTTTTLVGPITQDLVAGRTYTIFASGLAANMTVAANVLLDRSFDAQAQFVHAAPDAPAIDVLVDGQAAVSNLAYPNVTPYLSLPAGGACVTVAATGTTTPLLPAASLSLESASRQTVIALPATGTPAVAIAVFNDTTTPPAADRAKIRVIHASIDSGPVDVLSNDTALVSNLALGQASDFIDVAAGELRLRVNAAGTTNSLLGAEPIVLTLSGGQTVTIIFRGKVANQSLGISILSSVSGG